MDSCMHQADACHVQFQCSWNPIQITHLIDRSIAYRQLSGPLTYCLYRCNPNRYLPLCQRRPLLQSTGQSGGRRTASFWRRLTGFLFRDSKGEFESKELAGEQLASEDSSCLLFQQICSNKLLIIGIFNELRLASSWFTGTGYRYWLISSITYPKDTHSISLQLKKFTCVRIAVFDRISPTPSRE